MFLLSVTFNLIREKTMEQLYSADCIAIVILLFSCFAFPKSHFFHYINIFCLLIFLVGCFGFTSYFQFHSLVFHDLLMTSMWRFTIFDGISEYLNLTIPSLY